MSVRKLNEELNRILNEVENVEALQDLNDYVLAKGERSYNYIRVNVDNSVLNFLISDDSSIINKDGVIHGYSSIRSNYTKYNRDYHFDLFQSNDKCVIKIKHMYGPIIDSQEILSTSITPNEILKVLQNVSMMEDKEQEEKDNIKRIKKEDKEFNEQLLKTLEDNGFKDFILCYTRVYDRIFEGRDEDGYPDFSYEYNDRETDYVPVRYIKNLSDFGFEIENDLILIGTDEGSDSGEYPSGGYDADHITYSNYDVELRNRYYLINRYNETLKTDLKTYILNNYPESYLASLLQNNKVDFDKDLQDIIDALDEEDFD